MDSDKVKQMIEILTSNGYICKEISMKEFARVANMFPDSAFQSGDSRHTVYALDTVDTQFRKLCLYAVTETN